MFYARLRKFIKNFQKAIILSKSSNNLKMCFCEVTKIYKAITLSKARNKLQMFYVRLQKFTKKDLNKGGNTCKLKMVYARLRQFIKKDLRV